jgi:hypothetical protein
MTSIFLITKDFPLIVPIIVGRTCVTTQGVRLFVLKNDKRFKPMYLLILKNLYVLRGSLFKSLSLITKVCGE